ncbi:DUF4142 domain-containing protein [Catellatospora sichuanensis]|uniref:DUF4142 domain-containing protein n=1 Tax=Catellatospora sichuanensis TaxID=1969805 RepID=UPI00118278B2|nr:DUF4142 domain-containing protein [Catellatospora sichuanensis]
MSFVRNINVLAAALAVVLSTAAGPVAAAPTATRAPQDNAYLAAAHQANLAEITTSNLAATHQGASPVVVRLGAEFKDDHQKLDDALMSVAQQQGVALPNAPNTEQQAVIQQMYQLSRAPFDQAWVPAQLKAHEAAMAATQAEIANGQDPAVVQLAKDALPVIAKHHEQLMAAAAQLNVQIPVTPAGTAPR